MSLRITVDDRRARFLLGLGLVLFIGFFAATAWFRQVNLYTSQFDMGNMDQVLWQTLHGRWFTMTSPIFGVHESRAAVHTDFLLLGYLPFYALWPDPRMVMIMQVLFIASGAVPLWLLARRQLSPGFGLLFTAAYLLYPPLLWAMTFDVHAVVLAAPLFLWAWWAATEKRWWLYGAATVLVLTSKEEIGLVVAAMGLAVRWRLRQRTIGLLTACGGLAWSVAMVGLVIPSVRQSPGHFSLGVFSDYGQSFSQILTTMVLKPWLVLRRLLSVMSLGYVATLTAPLGFFAIAAWPLLLVATPELLINLLSKDAHFQSIYYQYTSAITPWVFIAGVAGTRWVLRRWPRFRPWVMGWLSVTLMVSVVWSAPLPGTRHHRDAIRIFSPSSYRTDVRVIQTLVRPTDRLALTNNIAPQFTRRAYAWSFPYHRERADGAVVLLGGQFEVVDQSVIRQAVEDLRADPRFVLAYRRGEIYYFRRVAPLAEPRS